MKLITDEDVKHIQPNPCSSSARIFIEVARVAIREFNKEEESTRHHKKQSGEALLDAAVEKEKYIQEQKLIDDVRAGTRLIIDEEEFMARANNSLGRDNALKRVMNTDHSPAKDYEERLKRERKLKRPMNTDHSPAKDDEERLRRERKLKRPMNMNEDEAKPAKKKPKRPVTKVPDSDIPDLPVEIENAIKALNGTRVKILIQKALTPTDMRKSHNRLSIMQNQLRDAGFLTEEEKQFLNTRVDGSPAEMRVTLIQPTGEIGQITFKKWDLKRNSKQYVFIREWQAVLTDNKLTEGEVVQVWTFRTPEGALGFALAKL